MKQQSILFVCAGNICRSPLAEGIFRHMAEAQGMDSRFFLDSAGIGGWHRGEPPDHRSVAVAAENGIDITSQRARKITSEDFVRFDLILAMDLETLDQLVAQAPDKALQKLALFAMAASGKTTDIPDPYYRDINAFRSVYDQISAACSSLIAKF
jgi:protein-tyrosine phosphatase